MSLLEFVECEKIFQSFKSQFQPVLKCLDSVQKMQTKSVVISIFNSLCYDIVPRVNKEVSFNSLENMMTVFTTVQIFPMLKVSNRNTR